MRRSPRLSLRGRTPNTRRLTCTSMHIKMESVCNNARFALRRSTLESRHRSSRLHGGHAHFRIARPRRDSATDPPRHTGHRRRTPARAVRTDQDRDRPPTTRVRALRARARGSARRHSTLISQHLRVLKTAGVVRGDRSGREVLYRLADDHLAHIVVDAVAHAQEPTAQESTTLGTPEQEG